MTADAARTLRVLIRERLNVGGAPLGFVSQNAVRVQAIEYNCFTPFKLIQHLSYECMRPRRQHSHVGSSQAIGNDLDA